MDITTYSHLSMDSTLQVMSMQCAVAVAFTKVSWHLILQQELQQLEQLTLQRPVQRSTATEQSADAAADIVSGQPLTERKSTFQAHLARPCTAARMSQPSWRRCCRTRKCKRCWRSQSAGAYSTHLRYGTRHKSCPYWYTCMFLFAHAGTCAPPQATHNIMAYRIWSEQRQLFDQDCDDDGESAAGSRLLHLLKIMNVGFPFINDRLPHAPCCKRQAGHVCNIC